MKDLSKNIYIKILKKGLNVQEAFAVLDEVKTLVEVGVNFEKCQHCGATIFYEDSKYCTQCGKELTNQI